MTFELDTPHGRMMAAMLAGIVQFERDLISERGRSGLAAAKVRGRKLSIRDGATVGLPAISAFPGTLSPPSSGGPRQRVISEFHHRAAGLTQWDLRPERLATRLKPYTRAPVADLAATTVVKQFSEDPVYAQAAAAAKDRFREENDLLRQTCK